MRCSTGASRTKDQGSVTRVRQWARQTHRKIDFVVAYVREGVFAHGLGGFFVRLIHDIVLMQPRQALGEETQVFGVQCALCRSPSSGGDGLYFRRFDQASG